MDVSNPPEYAKTTFFTSPDGPARARALARDLDDAFERADGATARARASDGTRTAEAVGRAHGMFAREGRAMRRRSLGSARVAGDAAACARVARASRVVGSGFRGRRRSGTETPRV
jgi:hypothetical protein